MCCFQTNQNHTILNQNKQESKKPPHCKRSFGLFRGPSQNWEAEDESTAGFRLTNKTAVIFIGNKYLNI